MGGKPIHRPKRSETLISSSAFSAAAIAPWLSTWSRGIRWRRLEVATNSTFSGGPATPPSRADFSALAAAAPSSNDRSSHSTTKRSGRAQQVEQRGQGGDLVAIDLDQLQGREFGGQHHEGGLGQRALAGAAHAPQQHVVAGQADGEAAEVLDEPVLLPLDADQQVQRQRIVGSRYEGAGPGASCRKSRPASKSGAAGAAGARRSKASAMRASRGRAASFMCCSLMGRCIPVVRRHCKREVNA
jgi:hypothetical protein